MFCDLNQIWTGDVVEAKERLVESLRLGYGCIAHNQVVTTVHELNTMSLEHPCIATLLLTNGLFIACRSPVEPIDLDSMIQISALEQEKSSTLLSDVRGVRQMGRITLSMGNADLTQALLHTSRVKNLQRYDIVAFSPRSPETLKQACEGMEIDVLSLDVTIPFVLKAKSSLLKTAVSRGIHIEVCYHPSMFQRASDKQTFCNFISKYSTMTCGKNTILSSGCSDAKFLRSPYDVISMATFLGFSKTHATIAVSTGCLEVIKHAEKRKKSVKLCIWKSLQTDDSESHHQPPVAKRMKLKDEQNSRHCS